MRHGMRGWQQEQSIGVKHFVRYECKWVLPRLAHQLLSNRLCQYRAYLKSTKAFGYLVFLNYPYTHPHGHASATRVLLSILPTGGLGFCNWRSHGLPENPFAACRWWWSWGEPPAVLASQPLLVRLRVHVLFCGVKQNSSSGITYRTNTAWG